METVNYYTENDRIPGEAMALWRSGDDWFLGDDRESAKPVTVIEAMNWYVRCRKFDNTSSGDIAPLVAVVAEQLWKLQKHPYVEDPTVKMTVEANAGTYGALVEAGLHHKCTPEKALWIFINRGNMLPEWANNDFAI
jgi:hypothetical protein